MSVPRDDRARARIGTLRALIRKLRALGADNGVGERFAAERQRDQDTVRRVERRRW
jgi:hypothetical protein